MGVGLVAVRVAAGGAVASHQVLREGRTEAAAMVAVVLEAVWMAVAGMAAA